MAHGRYGYLAIAKELSKGVPPSSGWIFLPFSGGGVKFEAEKMDSKALTGKVFKWDTRLGTFSFKGSLNGVELNEENSGLIWKSLLGSEEVVAEGQNWKHTFTLNANDYVSLTIEQYQTEWLRQYVNQKILGFTLKAEINAITSMDVETIGLDYITKNPVADKKQTSFLGAGISFYDVSIFDGAVELPAKSLEVSIREDAEIDYNFLGGRKGTDVLRGSFEGSIKIELNLSEASLDYWAKWLDETEKTLKVVIGKVDGKRIEFNFGRVKVSEYSENSGDELIKSSISFDVLADVTDANTFNVVCVNSREAVY